MKNNTLYKILFIGMLNMLFSNTNYSKDITPNAANGGKNLYQEIKNYPVNKLAVDNAIQIQDKYFMCEGCVDFVFIGFPQSAAGNKSASHQRVGLSQEKLTNYFELKDGFHWKDILKRTLNIIILIFILITLIFVFGAPGIGKAVALISLIVLISLLIGVSYVLGSYNHIVVDNSYNAALILQIDVKKHEIPANAYCLLYSDMGERHIQISYKDTGAKIDDLILNIPRSYYYPTTCSNIDKVFLNVGGKNIYYLSKIQYYSR